MDRRDRLALTIGACAILVVLLARQGMPVLLVWQREVRDTASRDEERLARAVASLARAPQVRDSLAARGARIAALAPALLGGDSPATASATLAGIVSGEAARSNVRIGTLQLSADTATRGTFVRVGVHGDGTGDIAGITSMLASLEGGPTLLSVRELSITQPEPAAPRDRAEALHVELTVVGLMLRRPAEEAK